jgi:uncharacterized protein
VRFWDTSAIVPLVADEAATARTRAVFTDDPRMAVWWGTWVECIGALARRSRRLTDAANETSRLQRELRDLSVTWSEVAPSDGLRALAEQMLWRHPLRTADALQLAAALVWSDGSAQGKEFVCLDMRLGDAAAGEGFTVLP